MGRQEKKEKLKNRGKGGKERKLSQVRLGQNRIGQIIIGNKTVHIREMS